MAKIYKPFKLQATFHLDNLGPASVSNHVSTAFVKLKNQCVTSWKHQCVSSRKLVVETHEKKKHTTLRRYSL